VTFIGLNIKFFIVIVTLLGDGEAPVTDETPKIALVASRTPVSVPRSILLALAGI
jgi:hypothetical protein